MHLYCTLAVNPGALCVGSVGGCEAGALASVEPTVKYHPYRTGVLTEVRDPDPGHCQAGSLTGAVASQSVTEARDGGLRAVGNRSSSAMA